MAVKPKIHARFSKLEGHNGVEVHVRTLTLDAIKVVDVRDYFPSLKVYGRGFSVPVGSLGELINGLVLANSEQPRSERKGVTRGD